MAAPTFSVQPTRNYNFGLTRTGPNNTPITVTFTPADAEQTGANELSYEIRTSATPGGGSLVGSGTCTSGAQKSHSLAYNATGLADGSNTLWVHLFDGTTTTTSNSFIVLRDDTNPTATTSISTTPSYLLTVFDSYDVAFTPHDAASTDAGELRASLYKESGASGFLKGVTGLTDGGATSFTSVGSDSLVPGKNTRYIRVRDGAGNINETSFTVTVKSDVPTRLRTGSPYLGKSRSPGQPHVW